MFQGFTQGTTDFLWGIRFNNERGWFLAHKEEFQTLVVQLQGQPHLSGRPAALWPGTL